jgi:hypothetical protein
MGFTACEGQAYGPIPKSDREGRATGRSAAAVAGGRRSAEIGSNRHAIQFGTRLLARVRPDHQTLRRDLGDQRMLGRHVAEPQDRVCWYAVRVAPGLDPDFQLLGTPILNLVKGRHRPFVAARSKLRNGPKLLQHKAPPSLRGPRWSGRHNRLFGRRLRRRGRTCVRVLGGGDSCGQGSWLFSAPSAAPREPHAASPLWIEPACGHDAEDGKDKRADCRSLKVTAKIGGARVGGGASVDSAHCGAATAR